MIKPPPRKLPNSSRRDAFGGSRSDHRQFLYLHEVDALITATKQTRAPIRNQALIMLLFAQALQQPSEICWLRWCDLNFTAILSWLFATAPFPSASNPKL